MPYVETDGGLTPKTRDLSRAIDSLSEEMEAVNWYQQRVDVVQDSELKSILEHNRDEEKEHAAMLLEWLQRQDVVLAKELKENLFSDGPIGHH